MTRLVLQWFRTRIVLIRCPDFWGIINTHWYIHYTREMRGREEKQGGGELNFFKENNNMGLD